MINFKTSQHHSGFLLVDKPIGCSSNAALQHIKKKLDVPKAGHAGTLDPLASGLLVICINQATKFAEWLIQHDKRYRFRIQLGVETETGDLEGAVVSQKAIPSFSESTILSLLRKKIGQSIQVVGPYSALKYQGKPLYFWARKGISVPNKQRVISIYALDLISYGCDFIELEAFVSPGTYIRYLAMELAEMLGTCGTVSELRRLGSGGYTTDQALTLDTIAQQAPEKIWSAVLPLSSLSLYFPEIFLTASQVDKLYEGEKIHLSALSFPAGIMCLYDLESDFIGIGRLDADGFLTSERLMAQVRIQESAYS